MTICVVGVCSGVSICICICINLNYLHLDGTGSGWVLNQKFVKLHNGILNAFDIYYNYYLND